MKRILVTCSFVSVLGVIACLSVFGQGTVSVMSDARWHWSAVDNAYMNREIENAAEQYKEYAPITRIAFYDIGYPKDKNEFETLNGYGVLLLCGLSQDGTELPIKRAYVAANGKEYELIRLKEVYVKNPDLASQSVKTFGQYRVDSLYSFPVYLRAQKAELFVDFTRNRTGMKLAEFDGTTPETIKQLPATRPQAGKKNDAAMEAFIKREYPGYTDK